MSGPVLPSLLVRANLGYFRRHPWLLAAALLGVILGVAGVAGVEITNHSARDNFRIANERLLGRATHRIRSQQPIDQRVLTQLRRDWGVPAAPVISRHVRLYDRQGPVLQLLALDPLQMQRFHPGKQVSDRQLGIERLLLRPAGALIGRITLERQQLSLGSYPLHTESGMGRIELIGTLGEPDDVRLSALLLMDIGRAQQLLGLTGLIDEIELELNPAQAEQISRWLPRGLQLLATGQQLQSNRHLTRALHLNLSAMGGLALVVGGFLVYNTLAFSLLQRQQLFGQLRTLGVTRRQLSAYLLLELLGIGVLGTLLGLLGGVALANLLLGLVTRTINDLYGASPIELLQLNPLVLVKVMLVGVGAALLAGVVPALRSLRQSTRQGQSRLQLEQRSQTTGRWLLLLALLLAGVALLGYQWRASGLPGAYLSVTALLLGCALVMPWLVNTLCRWGRGGLQRLGSQKSRLILTMALRDTERGLSRTSLALMALMIAVSATVAMSLMIGSFRTTLETWLQQRLNADLYLSPATNLPDDYGRLPEGVWEWLERQPEIAALGGYRRIAVTLQGGRIQLFASRLPPAARQGYRFRSGEGAAIWQAFDSADQILLSEPLANRYGLARGDPVSIVTPAGQQRFRVAGVYYDYGDSNGRAILSPDNFARHWPLPPVRVAAVYFKEGAAPSGFMDRLRRLQQAEQLQIRERQGVLQRSLEIFERTFLVTEALRLLALLVAFVGMFAALMALQLEREPEMKLHRALGLTPVQRLRLLMYQGLIVGGLAGLVAIPVGLLLAWGLIDLVQLRAFGWTLVYRWQWPPLLAAPLLSALTALLACIYPGWRQLRDPAVPGDSGRGKMR